MCWSNFSKVEKWVGNYSEAVTRRFFLLRICQLPPSPQPLHMKKKKREYADIICLSV